LLLLLLLNFMADVLFCVFFSEDERDAAWMCVIDRSDDCCIGGKSLVGEVPAFGNALL
jgi:hypothetical protein